MAWDRFFAGMAARRVDLPTYAFQRERFWLAPPVAGPVGLAGVGPTATGHPLLGASVELPGTDAVAFTGSISLSTHPWLADHAILGPALLPGTAFLDLALAAGEHVGCPRVDDLALQAPLALPAHGAVRLQVRVEATESDGRRQIGVYSRPQDDEHAWTQHAIGVLAPETGPEAEALTEWPPPGRRTRVRGRPLRRPGRHGIRVRPALPRPARRLGARRRRLRRRRPAGRDGLRRRLRPAPRAARRGPARPRLRAPGRGLEGRPAAPSRGPAHGSTPWAPGRCASGSGPRTAGSR